jgi:esterase/lipase superfamily enzyme
MQVQHHNWFSPSLGHDMPINVYGHFGRPLLVFPCAGGSHHEFEDFGMIDAIREFIDAGKVKVFSIASIDHQTWLNTGGHPGDRAARHEDYDKYVIHEVVPFIRNNLGCDWKIALAGNSLGAYHSVNFCLRHPDVFDATIALAGVYRTNHLIGDYMDDNVYRNSPIHYLGNMQDPWFLDHLRQAKIIICTGQGAWEYPDDAREMDYLFRAKGIPAWVDFWGHDVNHDWPWWRKMMPHFMPHIC